MKLQKLITNVQQWSIDRGLDKADSKKQMLKLYEEFGELASGLAKGNKEVVKDSIGDVVVALIILAQQQGLEKISDFNIICNHLQPSDLMPQASETIGLISLRVRRTKDEIEEPIVRLISYLRTIVKYENLKFEDCLSQAWNEIKDRKGKLIDGVWVKGYLDENGDIIISLGDDGYHRVLRDYVDSGLIECKKIEIEEVV